MGIHSARCQEEGFVDESDLRHLRPPSCPIGVRSGDSGGENFGAEAWKSSDGESPVSGNCCRVHRPLREARRRDGRSCSSEEAGRSLRSLSPIDNILKLRLWWGIVYSRLSKGQVAPLLGRGRVDPSLLPRPKVNGSQGSNAKLTLVLRQTEPDDIAPTLRVRLFGSNDDSRRVSFASFLQQVLRRCLPNRASSLSNRSSSSGRRMDPDSYRLQILNCNLLPG